jgi:hypothetical protein
MKQIDLDTWAELEAEIKKLHECLESKNSSISTTISKPLYRGHESSDFYLDTTLERYLSEEVSVDQYNRYLVSIKPAVESYTGNKWAIAKELKPDKDIFNGPLNYRFMAYVRHHGFPSPLLDWSQSLYIALFFAFQKASPDKRVAIYSYVEYLGKGKSGSLGAPQICELGPYISTHKRHFMQQGQYTVCVKKVNANWVYCSHEKYFSASNGKEQDYIIKYTLPGAIKNQVLKRLQSMNINAFTLFGSEDSLMEMLAFKEILNVKVRIFPYS